MTDTQALVKTLDFQSVWHIVEWSRQFVKPCIVFEAVHVWAGEAAALTEDASVTKQDYLDENPDRELPDVFWESLSARSRGRRWI